MIPHMTKTTIDAQSAARREEIQDARAARQSASQGDVTSPGDLTVDVASSADERGRNRLRGRARNAVLVAAAIEVQCPHCGAAQPAPGGSEFCEPSEAREMCDGASCRASPATSRSG